MEFLLADIIQSQKEQHITEWKFTGLGNALPTKFLRISQGVCFGTSFKATQTVVIGVMFLRAER